MNNANLSVAQPLLDVTRITPAVTPEPLGRINLAAVPTRRRTADSSPCELQDQFRYLNDPTGKMHFSYGHTAVNKYMDNIRLGVIKWKEPLYPDAPKPTEGERRKLSISQLKVAKNCIKILRVAPDILFTNSPMHEEWSELVFDATEIVLNIYNQCGMKGQFKKQEAIINVLLRIKPDTYNFQAMTLIGGFLSDKCKDGEWKKTATALCKAADIMAKKEPARAAGITCAQAYDLYLNGKRPFRRCDPKFRLPRNMPVTDMGYAVVKLSP